MNYLKKFSSSNLNSSVISPMLLGLALFLTVCGSLRIVDGFGIGELLLLLLSGAGWVRGRPIKLINSPFAWFWGLLAIFMSIGYLSNDLVANWVRRDTAAYFYTGTVSLGILLLLERWSDRQIKAFLRSVFLIALPVLWFGFVIYVIGDADWIRALRMDDQGDIRYTAWSTNANQLALFFVPLPIWLLILKPQGGFLRYGLWLALTFATMLMGFIVRSDALVLSWGLGLLLMMVVDWYWENQKELRWLFVFSVMAVTALGCAKIMASGEMRKTFVCSVSAISKLQNPFKNSCLEQSVFSGVESLRIGYSTPEDKTAIRMGLWKNALTVVADSPWVGHGPGAFSWYADPKLQASEMAAGKIREEAHNIPLDLMTQGGVLLGLAWLGLLGWLMVIAWQARVPYAFTWVFMLGFFTLFMYHLRHPYLWVTLILAQEIARRKLWSLKTKMVPGGNL